jgi:hypothetical protein
MSWNRGALLSIWRRWAWVKFLRIGSDCWSLTVVNSAVEWCTVSHGLAICSGTPWPRVAVKRRNVGWHVRPLSSPSHTWRRNHASLIVVRMIWIWASPLFLWVRICERIKAFLWLSRWSAWALLPLLHSKFFFPNFVCCSPGHPTWLTFDTRPVKEIKLPVPVRSNVLQHHYRWSQLTTGRQKNVSFELEVNCLEACAAFSDKPDEETSAREEIRARMLSVVQVVSDR